MNTCSVTDTLRIETSKISPVGGQEKDGLNNYRKALGTHQEKVEINGRCS